MSLSIAMTLPHRRMTGSAFSITQRLCLKCSHPRQRPTIKLSNSLNKRIEARTVRFVDPDGQRVRAVSKDGSGDWVQTGGDLELPALGVTLLHSEIFARD